MTPKEKAQELTKKFNDHVNPYMGSGMLSNTYDDSAILWQSKKCALICVDEILNGFRKLLPSSRAYWEEVRKEIENI